MSVSVDGFVADPHSDFSWTAPTDELFAVHLDRVSGLGAHLCGRRLYETMLPWENDPALAETDLGAAFAEAWKALPKIVFSRTLDTVRGNARLAGGSVVDEVHAVLDGTDKPVEIGGADLAAQAIRAGLVEEFHIFRVPVVLGGGTPYFPPASEAVPLHLVGTRTFEPGVIHEHYRRT